MTAIQWTEQTWNPIVGCSVVSPGCTNCYAMRMAWRMANNPATPHYAGTVKMVNGNPVWTGKIGQAPERVLTTPLRRRKPTIYFVNSMSDLFHEDVPDEWIDRVFAVMALCPRHQFQVLTKRAARMQRYMTTLIEEPHHDTVRRFAAAVPAPIPRFDWFDLPLPNVWLGVSAEDQRRADERIPLLLDTPAAVRFVSYEPALGPVDLRWIGAGKIDALVGSKTRRMGQHNAAGKWAEGDYAMPINRLDWVIVGGESGPGARPFNIAWARFIVKQCWAASVPVFVKQLGTHPWNIGPGHVSIPPLNLRDPKGGDMAEWPADLRVREMPRQAAEGPG